MPFSRIRLSSFRNLEDDEIRLDAPRIFLVGENGQGKTNFLEALYYLSFGSSFRGPVDAEVPRRGQPGFYLQGWSMREGAVPGFPLDEVKITWEQRVKAIRRNGKPIHDRKELVEQTPAIVFCHEDFGFAAGEPERRRFFFDQTASLVDPSYIDLVRDYKKILRQRNAALKNRCMDVLDLLDAQMAGVGLQLVAHRRKLRSALVDLLALRYEAVSMLGERIELQYRPSWKDESSLEGILELLRMKRSEELVQGTSLTGPHRDRWIFMRGAESFTADASTGQLRLLSLLLRIVQAELYSDVSGRLPVLLLDDVLLELDPGKRIRFLELLPQACQSVFTFLPGEHWEPYRGEETLVYGVKDGRLSI